MSDADEKELPSPSPAEIGSMMLYADYILMGSIRFRNGRWEFTGNGEHQHIQDVCNQAAAFLKRCGLLESKA